MIVFIDTGVLGLLSSPNKREEVIKSQEWLYSLLAKGVNVVSSDICDYEVRRGTFLTIDSQLKKTIINKLDNLHDLINFLPVSPLILRYAAELWAENRRQGLPTADTENIDVDVIIGATCQLLEQEYLGQRLVVATTNVKHLSRFIEAKEWSEITF